MHIRDTMRLLLSAEDCGISAVQFLKGNICVKYKSRNFGAFDYGTAPAICAQPFRTF